MARNESNREDLIREATALEERAEVRCSSFASVITLGYRGTGGLSIFFDQDPVYQFDREGRLRRAFVDGFLFRSQHSTLARLQRQRSDGRMTLLRHDLSPVELQDFQNYMHNYLHQLWNDLGQDRVQIVRQVPEGLQCNARFSESLQSILDCPDPWLSTEINARH